MTVWIGPFVRHLPPTPEFSIPFGTPAPCEYGTCGGWGDPDGPCGGCCRCVGACLMEEAEGGAAPCGSARQYIQGAAP